MIKILIADNHPIVRMGVKQVLDSVSDIQVIADASTTTELFNKLELFTPDVILLEMDIPEINGIATLRKIKKEYPNIRVLIYSGQSEDVYALSTIRAGAFGYLSKTSEIDYIISAIRKVSEGNMFITNELAQRLAFDEGTQKPRRFFRKLSTREVEVLKLLASGKRNKEVAQGLDLNEKTVSTYKARLMRKLNVDNLVDLLQQAKALELY
ncbi:DNA-binding NarL/FixJ family response regulator [Arenibacter algicola]|jgi:DNA-binding NarL/FixJ family response regulator|uniref:DNA-binding NarL/FixJ family response regulator n=2 Tax=Arenibacter TaxID=178469 RepID=A0A221UX65_9FLAO|nr:MULTISPECIES: response regulator transcription factor [Arenibacter]HCO86149.1 DNA-binding response regulator [Arenibacter sp.]ASO05934.1 response regulator UvrY [Arenibacter algicola]MDO6605231.1 response regulator transcription factor [Arenibacter palladensis]MDX1758694.1 response regulator transcription factor [Arenibacter algicola]SHG03069.1 DNA-binding response regulator, NarL/FixJ family, contains REC and HTH domains [Arenibacter palladensis]|tara:strand:- start:14249 stop:14878 length:630 start_codon:yes stop_codon:yes gene_type:complete